MGRDRASRAGELGRIDPAERTWPAARLTSTAGRDRAGPGNQPASPFAPPPPPDPFARRPAGRAGDDGRVAARSGPAREERGAFRSRLPAPHLGSAIPEL